MRCFSLVGGSTVVVDAQSALRDRDDDEAAVVRGRRAEKACDDEAHSDTTRTSSKRGRVVEVVAADEIIFILVKEALGILWTILSPMDYCTYGINDYEVSMATELLSSDRPTSRTDCRLKLPRDGTHRSRAASALCQLLRKEETVRCLRVL